MRNCLLLAAGLGLSVALSSAASAQVSVVSQFKVSGTPVGLGYDPFTDSLWIYKSFGTVIEQYSTAGVLLGSIPRGGEGANDVDIEIAPVGAVIGSTAVPAGTLFFINGETGAAEIYAIDKNSGAVLATLNTSFGVSHVVGGAYHPTRGTFFLVQDRVPGGNAASVIAEINPATGAVIHSFRIADVVSGFTVDYGDLDIGSDGNLYVVSSDELSIGEFMPDGAFVTLHTLPTFLSSLSGIGIDDFGCETWLGNTSGAIVRASGMFSKKDCVVCRADFNHSGSVNSQDFFDFITAFFAETIDADFNDDAVINSQDYFDFITAFFAGC